MLVAVDVSGLRVVLPQHGRLLLTVTVDVPIHNSPVATAVTTGLLAFSLPSLHLRDRCMPTRLSDLRSLKFGVLTHYPTWWSAF